MLPISIGSKTNFECSCPRCLASGTVECITSIQQLIQIFEKQGFGGYWDIVSETGNPAASLLSKEYLKFLKEQA